MKKTLKKTRWFPPQTEPVRPGVYEWKTGTFPRGGWFRLYRHGRWYPGGNSPEAAMKYVGNYGPMPTQKPKALGHCWRGLASKDGK